ncbi:hypothetical protein [Nodularia spumigena]|uniref:hypothetical protein n=1 Tax=Nodularia spumigena TaxID=70799 RepID=UPI00232BA9CC|nr:hypothetical protein [Nodularia spumigena]MDB9316174.1 hypothetical protein [Nodularia spumigena CS-590/01A]MDB9327839.1 hypothetical protein [Nodularia spumigena CS-590/02]MDB9337142.1 hypothetical protein [Nodularia spumigena CS-590/01]MDB9346235.1 hypothetical protein [Nodularia spumigena CS-588/01]MDB9353019.1 hypothetical protein [Nodularia spumigena CS-588/05]
MTDHKPSEFLQENNGNLSSTRLAFLTWVFGVIIVWGFNSIRNNEMKQIPESVQVIIATLMSGKTIQKFGEKCGTEKPKQAA